MHVQVATRDRVGGIHHVARYAFRRRRDNLFDVNSSSDDEVNASRWSPILSRVLFPRSLPCAGGGHSSGPPVAGRLKRPTRNLESARATPASFPAIPLRSCSRWGLPCPSCHQEGGVLLPHRFTLAWSRGFPCAWRSIFCCTFLRVTSTGR